MEKIKFLGLQIKVISAVPEDQALVFCGPVRVTMQGEVHPDDLKKIVLIKNIGAK